MNEVVDWVNENAQTIVVSGTILLAIALVAGFMLWDRRASFQKYLDHRRELRIQRGVAMGHKKKAARLNYVKGLLADGITNALEEAWFKGLITEEERNACYRMIGKTHGIPDLLPLQSNSTIKAMVKGRRARGGYPGPVQEEPAWGEPTPVPPKVDEQLPKQDAKVINATKRFGEKALKRLKPTG